MGSIVILISSHQLTYCKKVCVYGGGGGGGGGGVLQCIYATDKTLMSQQIQHVKTVASYITDCSLDTENIQLGNWNVMMLVSSS